MRDYPKWVVSFQTDFDDERMSPQAAAIEAMREMRRGAIWADVRDVDSKRMWAIKFRAHVLEVIECSEIKPELTLPGRFPWLAAGALPSIPERG